MLFMKLSVHFQGTNIIWTSQIKVILSASLLPKWFTGLLKKKKKKWERNKKGEQWGNLMNRKLHINKTNNSQVPLIHPNKPLVDIKRIFLAYTLPVFHKGSGIKIECRITSSTFIPYFGWHTFHLIEGIWSRSSLSP